MKTFSAIYMVLQVVLTLLLPGTLLSQEDDFNDGNDDGWSRFTPLDPFGGTAISVSGGVYRLACEPSPNAEAFGPARCGSLRLDASLENFCVMVDIGGLAPGEDTSTGILARIQPGAGPGAVNGYAFTYQAGGNDVQISRVVNEEPVDISGTVDVTLLAGHRYRMVFFGVGARLEGRIYDTEDLSVPVVTATAADATFSAGNCGLVVFADTNTRASATFDNYTAGTGEVAPPALAVVDGQIRVSWPAEPALCHSLEVSSDLQVWEPAAGSIYDAGQIIWSETITDEKPARYYRLRMGQP